MLCAYEGVCVCVCVWLSMQVYVHASMFDWECKHNRAHMYEEQTALHRVFIFLMVMTLKKLACVECK